MNDVPSSTYYVIVCDALQNIYLELVCLHLLSHGLPGLSSVVSPSWLIIFHLHVTLSILSHALSCYKKSYTFHVKIVIVLFT